MRRVGICLFLHCLTYDHGKEYEKQPSRKISYIGKDRTMTTSNSNLYLDDNAERIFCISMQRTGTTSVGKFFRDFGFYWAELASR